MSDSAALDQAPYVPSATFRGARAGYYFSSGPQGTGYYADKGTIGAGAGPPSSLPTDFFGGGPGVAPPIPTSSELLASAEAQAGESAGALLPEPSPAQARRLVQALQRAAQANLEARTRHASEPRQFLDSELALDEAAAALGSAAGAPGWGAALAAAQGPEALVLLLEHPNADLASGVMQVLSELCEQDEGGESEADLDQRALDAARVAGGALQAGLASRLGTWLLGALPACQDSDAELVPAQLGQGQQALELLQSLAEALPGAAGKLLGDAGLRTWLLAWVQAGKRRKGVEGREAGEARLTLAAEATETLGVLLHACHQQRLVDDDGRGGEEGAEMAEKEDLDGTIKEASDGAGQDAATRPASPSLAALDALASPAALDAMLLTLASFRGAAELAEEEAELALSLCDALCTLLLRPRAQAAFLAAEGVELLLLLLRGPKKLRPSALRALEFAVADSPGAGVRVVERGGLGVLGGALLGRLRVGSRNERSADWGPGRAVTVLAAVCEDLMEEDGGEGGQAGQHPLTPSQNPPSSSSPAKAALRARVVAKFEEAQHEKADALVELFHSHLDRVGSLEEACRKRLEEARGRGLLTPELRAALLEELEEDKAERGGLFTLQRLAIACAFLWQQGSEGLRRRLLKLLHVRGVGLAALRGVLQGLLRELGDVAHSPEARQRRERKLGRLLAAVGGGERGLDGGDQARARDAAGETSREEDGARPLEGSRKRSRSQEAAEEGERGRSREFSHRREGQEESRGSGREDPGRERRRDGDERQERRRDEGRGRDRRRDDETKRRYDSRR